jgi:hypothetical protein
MKGVRMKKIYLDASCIRLTEIEMECFINILYSVEKKAYDLQSSFFQDMDEKNQNILKKFYYCEKERQYIAKLNKQEMNRIISRMSDYYGFAGHQNDIPGNERTCKSMEYIRKNKKAQVFSNVSWYIRKLIWLFKY